MTNLYGLLNLIRPAAYTHTQDSLSAFVQLSQGLGDIRFHIDIRRARDDRVIHTSHIRTLSFERRTQVLQVVTHFRGIRFDEPGMYFVELFCDNTWVGDVTLELEEGTP
jgi:hypothetical protein